MDDLLRLLDEARAEERGASRERERWLRQAAEEGARLAGTLLDLAEQGATVTVRTTTGGSHHGTVRLVATDFCVLGAASGDVWLHLAGVTTVRPHADERHAAATGDRPVLDLRLVEALARVAPDRPRLGIVAAGGERLAGELRAVGADVLTIRLDGDPRAICYLAADAVREIVRSG